MSAGTRDPKSGKSGGTDTKEAKTAKRDDLPSPYTPIDQSVFEHQTGEAEERIDERRREKEELQRQQRIVTLIAGIVVALVVVAGVVAIIINTVS
ncbi:MAG: hypothetical protein GF320_06045 [Armatimonadia bacterium]|nr:hypothetical protein [Armatimonadia bacterium]